MPKGYIFTCQERFYTPKFEWKCFLPRNHGGSGHAFRVHRQRQFDKKEN